MPQPTAIGKKARAELISAIIVHWNTPELLRRCLASLRHATATRELEIVVVDCASPGANVAAILDGCESADLIKLDRNAGYAAGCNAGARGTCGEVLFFLNADTEIEPGAIDAVAACFDLNPRIGLIAPLLLNADASIQSAGYAFPGAANIFCDLLPVPDRVRGSRLNGRADPGNGFHPYAIDYALGAAVAVRRSALTEIGGWDESYGMYSEEIDLARRLDASGWTRLIEPRARVVHFGGASTEQRPDEMQAALWRSRGLYHRRWSSRPRQIALRALVESASRLTGAPAVVRRAFASGLAR